MTSSMSGYAGLKGATGSRIGGLNTGSSRSFGSDYRNMKRGGGPGDKVPSGYRVGQLQQFTPEQMELFKQQFGQVSPESYTSRLAGGDQSLFEEMEAPAHRQFAENIGNLASRFSGMGMGARRSSGFQNATTSAASNFAQDLQANRQGLQRQAIKDLISMSSELLGQKPQDRFVSEKRQKQPGFGQSIAGPLIGAAGTALGGYLGGPPGAMAGNKLGQLAVNAATAR